MSAPAVLFEVAIALVMYAIGFYHGRRLGVAEGKLQEIQRKGRVG